MIHHFGQISLALAHSPLVWLLVALGVTALIFKDV